MAPPKGQSLRTLLDEKFAGINQRFAEVNQRLDGIDGHLHEQDADLEQRTMSILQTIEGRYQDARLWSAKLFALVDQDVKLHREQAAQRTRPRTAITPPAKRK